MTESVPATPGRPLAVRVLRGAGLAALAASAIAFGIGWLLGFDELAKIWAVVAVLLFMIALTALAGTRPSRLGMFFALVACLLLLFLPPVGTIVTIAVALVASQNRQQLRDYYGLRRRPA